MRLDDVRFYDLCGDGSDKAEGWSVIFLLPAVEGGR